MRLASLFSKAGLNATLIQAHLRRSHIPTLSYCLKLVKKCPIHYLKVQKVQKEHELDRKIKKSVSQLANIFNGRFEKLILDIDEAIIDAGLKTEQMRMLEDSEQHEARRDLLMIEELANKKREIKATQENSFLLQVEADFHQTLIADLEIEFRDIQSIMEKTLGFNASLGEMLDLLYKEACSIS